MAPSDFHNFFEVATGPCKNAVNLACGDFLSSLFSLLSFFLRMSKLACSFPMPMQISSNVLAPVLISADLCRMSQLAWRAGWLRKGSAPPWRPHLGTFGGLFWCLFSLLSSLFALRSSLFSLLSSPGLRGLVRPRSHESSHPLDS